MRVRMWFAATLLLAGYFSAPFPANAQLKLPGVVRPQAAEAAPPAPQPAAPAASLAIPLPQIADQAEALDIQLEEISRELTTKPEASLSDRTLTDQTKEIAQRAAQVDSFLQSGPDILQLREEIVYWRALNRMSADQRKQLTIRADELQQQISLLTTEQTRWQATRDQIHDDTGIEVVATRVHHELEAIDEIRARAQTQLNEVLTLQNQLSQTGRGISDSLAKLTDAESHFRISILDRDAPPLWSSHAFQDHYQPIAQTARRSANQEIFTVGEFVRVKSVALLCLPIAYILFVFAAFRLKRYLTSQERPGVSARAQAIFSRPFDVALLATLLLTNYQAQAAPLSVATVDYLLWTYVLFRLIPLLIEIRLRWPVYLLLALNLLELVRIAAPLTLGIRRTLLPVIILVVLLALGWLVRPTRLRQLGLPKWPAILFRIAVSIGILLLAIALAANVLGFLALSRALGVGTLLSAFLAVALYCVARFLLLLLAVLLDSSLCRAFSGDLRSGIECWTRRALIAAGVVLWAARSELYVLLFRDSFTAAATGALDYPLDLGTIHFTLGNVITVLLTLAIGFSLAKGFSSLMRTVLVAKFPSQRGMPYAASKVAYYCLSVLVLLAAVAAAGVDLNKFTVITGAVGVGVGFGLQNIVNNFASGLILLFERPIRVEDTVEVNGLVGTVKRIGARSSTIATFQGAEVIVPNSNLVQNHVINWTLSSPQRRIEILVGVAYGTDPEMVLGILIAVAKQCKNVMTNPAPAAFFTGFGDSALNFELRFWSASQDIWFQLKSEVTVGVARALRDAGIEIPFPQRDLHLRSVDTSIVSLASLSVQSLAGTAKPDAVDGGKANPAPVRPTVE